ncbi:MAG TPA: methionine adenosyltransferase [Thermodesulfobacteriota bacterium]|nr:methionine adenosyltransferase [Thermodesulfobacteriota bacterium]
MGSNIFVKFLTGNMPYEEDVEIVERKGIGHPDTICDNVAEQVSIALSRYYLEEFGAVMHHNVDKGLLVAGIADPSYGGGKVVKPIEVVIAGRGIKDKNGSSLPIDEITVEAVNRWLRQNIRHLDTEKDVVTKVKIRPGSRDLIELFEGFGRGGVPLSNDTSIGVGFYPLDELEKSVKRTEGLLNSDEIKKEYPFIGEDIKVIGVRNQEKIRLTVAVATVDRYISNLHDYIDKISSVKALLVNEVSPGSNLDIEINVADNYEKESIYLTVTGTSAEHGDDGQVGRGNRVNGLITPYRPMSLEAAGGKNAVSHVGKIYSLFAKDLSMDIVENGYAEEAYVYIVSQIGKPINQPQALDIGVKGKGVDINAIRKIADDMLCEIPGLWKKVIAGKYDVA